jgi:cellular retinoic acid-binding protein 2
MVYLPFLDSTSKTWNNFKVIRLESTFKNTETKFTDGVEFNEETLDGRKCKSVITSEGPNKLVQVQKDAKNGKVVSTITREIVTKDEKDRSKDQLVMTLVAGKVTSKRTYKRV